MQRSPRPSSIGLKLICWFLVVAYALAATVYGVLMYHLFTAPTPPGTIGLLCANSVTDPLGTILQYGTPTALTAIFALGVLWQRHLANFRSIVFASVIFLGCTASLVTFGAHFFQTMQGFFLSDIVWWMRPFGKFAGV